MFGVMTEALPQVVLFLLDEAVEIGKGANTIISLLDFFLENYGLKKVACHLHANNCSGQNKNNAMLHYLMWRVMTGCHSDITLLFLLTGHTKFGPDWCLGLFKRRFHRTRVDCLADIVQVTKAALSTGILTPQLGSDEAGNVLVPSRDWMAFLSEWFRKLVGLKKFHHFQFKASGEVLCCENGASEVTIFSLLKGPAALPDTLPTIVQPSGLSQQRKGYLFQEIQEFVNQDYQDLVCPESPQSFTKAPAPPAPEDPAKPSTSAATSTATTRTPGRPKKQHQEAWLPRGSD